MWWAGQVEASGKHSRVRRPQLSSGVRNIPPPPHASNHIAHPTVTRAIRWAPCHRLPSQGSSPTPNPTPVLGPQLSTLAPSEQ